MSLALAFEPQAIDPLHEPTTSAVLYLDDISVSFDGFKALNQLSLIIGPAEMRAIIGPNGAGKTTMMDVITGKTRPDAGTAFYDQGTCNLLKMDVAEIADAGIGRKFQKPSVFESQTVGDNILLALKGPRGAINSIFGARGRVTRERILEVLERVALADAVRKPAGDLSHGQKQWLEIGMLLAQDPKLLLVDEPVAGMTDAETETTATLLKEIAKTRSVVVVEHDMTFVRALGVKVTCLHEGSVLAEGTLDDVSNNQRVIEVYLGR
jgi:urea transport system ATP-binding protein